MNPLALYAYIGLAVFAVLMLYRIGGLLIGKFEDLIPDVSRVPWPYGTLTRGHAAVILLGACLVAWPVVITGFLAAGKNPPARH